MVQVQVPVGVKIHKSGRDFLVACDFIERVCASYPCDELGQQRRPHVLVILDRARLVAYCEIQIAVEINVS